MIALLARMGTLNPSEKEINEFRDLLQAVENNYPALLAEMRPTANQVKRFLRKRGVRLTHGQASSDVPVVSVDGPLMRGAIATFARKLFLALHYKHSGKVVPSGGGVAIKWITNATSDNSELLSNIETLRNGLPHAAEMRRSNTSLEDQFSYRYFANAEGTFSAYFVIFRQSFLMIGAVRTDAQAFPDVMREIGMLTPFHMSNP